MRQSKTKTQPLAASHWSRGAGLAHLEICRHKEKKRGLPRDCHIVIQVAGFAGLNTRVNWPGLLLGNLRIEDLARESAKEYLSLPAEQIARRPGLGYVAGDRSLEDFRNGAVVPHSARLDFIFGRNIAEVPAA